MLLPFGLGLASRFFLDLDSDLLVPRMALVILCTVLSIDSCRDSFGDLAGWAGAGVPKSEHLPPPATEPSLSFLSDENPVFLIAYSFVLAPSSWARFLTALDSGLGFMTLQPEAADVGVLGSAKSSSECSGPSSGMVAWLSDDLECFLSRTSVGEPVIGAVDEIPSPDKDEGEVCKALEGRGDTSPEFLLLMVKDWVEMVSLGEVETTTMHWGLHSGEIVVLFFPSDDLGWILSGERARRRSGDPGSADLGRLKDFLAELGVRLAPGL